MIPRLIPMNHFPDSVPYCVRLPVTERVRSRIVAYPFSSASPDRTGPADGHPDHPVPAAPARSGRCGYGCCFRAHLPHKGANSRIIYKSPSCVKKNLSTYFPRQNVDKVENLFRTAHLFDTKYGKINFFQTRCRREKVIHISTKSVFHQFGLSTNCA